MYPLARTYAISVLRAPGTWFLMLGTAFFAWAGISLDLFGFDGSEIRSIGVTVGTCEITAVLLAVRARVSGIASIDAEGFRAAVQHRSGALALELGCTLGSGVGALVACAPVAILVLAIYNLLPQVGLSEGGLLGLGLAAEASLAAAWTGLAAKVAGRVPAIAIAMGVFVLARCNVPHALRAILPAPLPLSASELAAHSAYAILAALGLSLAAAAMPDSATQSA